MNLVLRIPRELVSPNKWNGSHWRVKHRISQEWEREAWSTLLLSGLPRASFLLAGRKRVSVTREVPSGRNFIRDDDNLRFSVKPLLDALKRLGLIVNDSRKWIDLPTPEQKVSDDGGFWTEVQIEVL